MFTKSVSTDFITENPIKICFRVAFWHTYGQNRAKNRPKKGKSCLFKIAITPKNDNIRKHLFSTKILSLLRTGLAIFFQSVLSSQSSAVAAQSWTFLRNFVPDFWYHAQGKTFRRCFSFCHFLLWTCAEGLFFDGFLNFFIY